MEAETQLLEAWKANHDLWKFCEDLKQKRFAHCLTIQAAFLAFFALLAKDALATFAMTSMTALVLIAVPPLIISFYFIRIDNRGRAFVDIANGNLHRIEREWKGRFPDSHFSNYLQSFPLLSSHDDEMLRKHSGNSQEKDHSRGTLLQSKSAHASEHAILQMFWWLWIFLASSAALVHLRWHLVYGFRAMV